MNASIYRISLELQDTQANVNLDVKRGDTKRILHISLTDGGKPYQISDECTAVFTALKPDGKKVFNDCQISGNEILYTLTPQTVVAEGVCQCEIKLYGADSGLLTSARFELAVNETVYNEGDVIESTDEFNELARLIGEASAVPSSVLLKEDDKLDALVENGRYYLAGGTDNLLIRQMLRDAGVPVPEEMDAEGVLARAMFVDVTRVERVSTDSDDPMGQPCQHLTVYFKKDRSEDAWAFEYHRVHSFTGSHPDGSAWGGWITATRNGLEVESDVFIARFGETTNREIWEAVQAGKVCVATDGGNVLPLTWWDGTRYMEFTKFSNGVNRMFTVQMDTWEDVSDKYLKEDEIRQVFVAEYGVTTAAEVCQAFQEGKACFAHRNAAVLPMVNCDANRQVVYFCGMDYGFYTEFRLSAGGWQEIRTDYRKVEGITEDADGRIPTAKAVWDLTKTKLDAEKLPEAVEEALVKAKASGEFDGPQGPQGEPGGTGEVFHVMNHDYEAAGSLDAFAEPGSYVVEVGSKMAEDYPDLFVAPDGTGAERAELVVGRMEDKAGAYLYQSVIVYFPVMEDGVGTYRSMTAHRLLHGDPPKRRWRIARGDLKAEPDGAAAIEDLAEAGIVDPVADENNGVFVDENDHVYVF